MSEPICRVCDSAITPEAQKFLFVTDKDFRPIHPTCLIDQQAKDIDRLIAQVENLKSALHGSLQIANEYYAFGLTGFDGEYANACAVLKEKTK